MLEVGFGYVQTLNLKPLMSTSSLSRQTLYHRAPRVTRTGTLKRTLKGTLKVACVVGLKP